MAHSKFTELVKLVAKLRCDAGCPWDRAQSHQSLRPYMLEEAHEAVAAIDAHDYQALVGELGDVLLQVILHSQIAAEANEFSIDDVITHLSEKLVRRHPHVFSDAVDDLESIKKNWSKIKAEENYSEHRLPTLLAARKLVEQQFRSNEQLTYPTNPIDKEETAGREILEAIAAVWEQKIDPEIALCKALNILTNKHPTTAENG